MIVDASSLDDPDLVVLTEWARAEAGSTDGTLPTLLRARQS